jgi:hypothetical protein
MLVAGACPQLRVSTVPSCHSGGNLPHLQMKTAALRRMMPPKAMRPSTTPHLRMFMPRTRQTGSPVVRPMNTHRAKATAMPRTRNRSRAIQGGLSVCEVVGQWAIRRLSPGGRQLGQALGGFGLVVEGDDLPGVFVLEQLAQQQVVQGVA